MGKDYAAVRNRFKKLADADGSLAPHYVERARLLAQPGVLEIYDDARGDDGLYWAWHAKKTGRPVDRESLRQCIQSRQERGAPVDRFALVMLDEVTNPDGTEKKSRGPKTKKEQLAVGEIERRRAAHLHGGKREWLDDIYNDMLDKYGFGADTMKSIHRVFQTETAKIHGSFLHGGNAALRQHLWESGAEDAAIEVSYLRMRIEALAPR